jgi:hypothetical protein
LSGSVFDPLKRFPEAFHLRPGADAYPKGAIHEGFACHRTHKNSRSAKAAIHFRDRRFRPN